MSAEEIKKLAHLDYSHEIAFVALDEDSGRLLGLVRLKDELDARGARSQRNPRPLRPHAGCVVARAAAGTAAARVFMLFLVGGDDRLPVRARLLQPIGGELLADLLQTGLERRRG